MSHDPHKEGAVEPARRPTVELPDSDDDAYEPSDPKSPGFHSRLSDLWDSRDGK